MIVQIEYIPGSTPAKIYPRRQLMILDKKKFSMIPSVPMRVFVLAHELAHTVELDELAADLLAFDLYVKRGYPIRSAIFAITRLLEPSTAHKRAINILRRLSDVSNLLADEKLQSWYED